MKKAFTMIELIFVIIILGVIAAVAIPKLFVSREDAEIVVLKNELAIIRTGIDGAYQESVFAGKKAYPSVTKIAEKLLKNNKWSNSGNSFTYKASPSLTIDFTYDENSGIFRCVSAKCSQFNLN